MARLPRFVIVECQILAVQIPDLLIIGFSQNRP